MGLIISEGSGAQIAPPGTLTPSQAVVTNGSGQLTTLPYSANDSTSNIASRDSSGNSISNNWANKATATTSSGGTVTMTAASSQIQVLNGSSNHTYKLPDATTLAIGWAFFFNNNSSGTLTIQNASAGAITTVLPGGAVMIYAIAVSTSSGAWDYHYLMPSNSKPGTSQINLPQIFTVGGTLFADPAAFLIYDGSGNTAYDIASAQISRNNSVVFDGRFFTIQNAGTTYADFSTAAQGIQLKGSDGSTNASSGNIGEYVSSSVAVGSGVALSSGTAATITSITLTAGDWDISAIGAFNRAGSGQIVTGISTTTNSLAGANLGVDKVASNWSISADVTNSIPPVRVKPTTSTTYYLVSQIATSNSTTGYGSIFARRVR